MSEWREVWSEAVQALAHDPATGELRVRWRNGRVSVYTDVDTELAEQVRKSHSVGSALWSLRHGNFSHRYEDEK